MENLKIKCENTKQGKQAQELFFSLGYGFEGCKNKNIQELEYVSDFYLFAYSDGDLTHSCDYGVFMNKAHKEITIQELRDMVTPMKEYLSKNSSGNYQLVNHRFSEDDIEVPDGAEAFGHTGIVQTFYKDDFRSFFNENTDGQWDERSETWIGRKDPVILWQRHTQPEELPFLDSLPEFKHCFGASLNNQYAEIEQVRKHRHYFKDVSNIAEIDVYTVLKLFDVTDPCLQHIVKKALCAGKRGHKDMMEDLQNIVDTAIRAVELNS